MITLTNVKQNNCIGICSFNEISEGEPIVLALGMFDGVHAGHRRLFGQTRALSEKYGASPTVLTFVNHPHTVIASDNIPLLINTVREKAMLAADCGIKQMVALCFDDEFAALSPDAFIEKYILSLNTKGVVCGYNYRFGKAARGDCAFLSEKLKKCGIEVCVEDKYCIDGIAVNSTYIRTLIESGDIARANKFLSSEYIVSGNVAHGYERGRTLGFPTANIIPVEDKLLPPNGVYVTKTVIDSTEFISVTNIGNNPTYSNKTRTVETFVTGFDGDLYGKYIVVKFYKKLRDEIKFESVEALVSAIASDKQSALDFFG